MNEMFKFIQETHMSIPHISIHVVFNKLNDELETILFFNIIGQDKDIENIMLKYNIMTNSVMHIMNIENIAFDNDIWIYLSKTIKKLKDFYNKDIQHRFALNLTKPWNIVIDDILITLNFRVNNVDLLNQTKVLPMIDKFNSELSKIIYDKNLLESSVEAFKTDNMLAFKVAEYAETVIKSKNTSYSNDEMSGWLYNELYGD